MKFLCKTRRPRPLKFGTYYPVDLNQECSHFSHRVKTWPRPRGSVVLHRFISGNFFFETRRHRPLIFGICHFIKDTFYVEFLFPQN